MPMKDKLAKTTGESFLKMMKQQNEGDFPIDIRVDRVSMNNLCKNINVKKYTYI